MLTMSRHQTQPLLHELWIYYPGNNKLSQFNNNWKSYQFEIVTSNIEFLYVLPVKPALNNFILSCGVSNIYWSPIHQTPFSKGWREEFRTLSRIATQPIHLSNNQNVFKSIYRLLKIFMLSIIVIIMFILSTVNLYILLL